MTDLGSLRPGGTYEVARVESNAYLVLKGFESSPAGGLHWTEFELKK